MKGRTLRRMIYALIAVLVIVWWLTPRAPSIEPGSVLELELEGAYVESAEPSLMARLLGPAPRPLASLLSELALAERDERLAAVVLRVRPLEIGWGKAQELRNAIARLGESGRRTIAYLELESMGANLEYYVASAAQEVLVGEAGRAPLVGLAGEYLFFGGFFGELGVDVEMERVGRYKSAGDTWAGRQMSDAHREMAEALIDSVDAQFVAGIAAARGLSEEAVRAAIDAAPSEPAALVSHGLIDGVESYGDAVARAGDGPRVTAETWRAVDPASLGIAPEVRVALVYASGALVTGDGGATPLGAVMLGSDTLAQALRDAAADPDIHAILLRVDSPGGSALASDLVWNAVQEARESGKPLVASFSDVAASGGYYLAAGADAIVASPATITGSIGVLVVRPVVADLLEKLEIGVATITRGAHAEIQLASRPLSAASRDWLRREVKTVYELFVQRVAAGRPLEPAAVDRVGRGRVWTGAQAAELGLVDELGGLREATDVVRQRLGLAPDTDVALVSYPPPRPLAEQIAEAFTRARVGALTLASPVAGRLARLEPWLDAAREARPVALLPFSVELR